MADRKIVRLGVREFREQGYLQEVNRCFLHPLGLALEVIVNTETGQESFGGVWDFRNDPEGMMFGPGDIDKAKADSIGAAFSAKIAVRQEQLGFGIQPPELTEEQARVLSRISKEG